jgi:hypothetical protein
MNYRFRDADVSKAAMIRVNNFAVSVFVFYFRSQIFDNSELSFQIE